MFNYKKFTLVFALGFIFFSLPKNSHAQMLVDVYGQGALPVFQLKDKGYNNGLGFGFGIMSNPLFNRKIETPAFVNIHAGGSFAFTAFGMKKYELELAEPQSGMADVKVSNINFALTPTIRAVFGNGKVQPYVDAFGGLQFFNASQTIAPQNYSANSGYEKETQTNLANYTTYFAGLSAGVLFKLSESVFVNTGLSYGWGGNANLLPLKNIEQNGNELNYTFTKSQTNMLLIKFGFTFKAERSDDDDYNDNHNYSPNNNNSQPSRGKSNEIRKNPKSNVGY